MAKYKVGDRVRIVRERPASPRFYDSMVMYLGKTLTVSGVVEEPLGAIYQFEEAKCRDDVLSIVKSIFPNTTGKWAFYEDWISGLAEPMPKQRRGQDLKVVIRFSGNTTTARLIRGGTVVKTATARRNPADNYSHAKGAALAMERLFAKKEEQP